MGTYTGRHVNFNNFAVSSFNPHLFTGDVRAGLGCGFSALALLTGTAPEVIAAKRRSIHCSDAFMLRYLRGNGFQTLQLTQCNLSLAKRAIRVDHVLLLSQLFQRNEGTWIVQFNNLAFHNLQCYIAGCALLHQQARTLCVSGLPPALAPECAPGQPSRAWPLRQGSDPVEIIISKPLGDPMNSGEYRMTTRAEREIISQRWLLLAASLERGETLTFEGIDQGLPRDAAKIRVMARNILYENQAKNHAIAISLLQSPDQIPKATPAQISALNEYVAGHDWEGLREHDPRMFKILDQAAAQYLEARQRQETEDLFWRRIK